MTNKLRLIFWQAFKKPKHATRQPQSPKAKAIKSDATLLITNSELKPKPKPKSKQVQLEKLKLQYAESAAGHKH